MKRLNVFSLFVISLLSFCSVNAQESVNTQQWQSLKTEPNSVPVEPGKVGNIYHVVVGQAIFFNTDAELTRVYVDNPLVLTAFATNPHKVLVSGKSAGTATIVLSDKDGANTSYSIRVDVNVGPLQDALESNFPMDKIAASADQDNVVLTGYVISKEEYTQVDKLASSYGKGVFNSLRIAPPHERQVRLQVKFVEVDRTRMQQAGFNFLALGKTIGMTGTGQSSPFQAPSISSTSTTGQSVTVNNPMNLLLFSSGLNIGAAIEDLESKNVLQILAEPTINALSGHKARFLSGGMFPYPMVQGGTAGQTSVTVQFMPYGVKLEFEPYVLDDGTIRLHVAPEVSALDYTNEVQIAGLSIPAMATRSAETDIELRDGQTFMLSGLLDHRVTDAFQKMPGISSIPILGQLFRSKNVQSSTTDLLVIVTPTIVDPLTMPQPAPVLPKATKPFLNNDSFDNSLNAIRKP